MVIDLYLYRQIYYLIYQLHAPAVLLFGEPWLFDVQTRREWIFALLILVFAGILIEHSNLGAQ